jgi:hypothetical protein
MRSSTCLLVAALAAIPVSAQSFDWAKRFNATLGGGGGIPGQDIGTFMSSSGLFRLGFGYRFQRNLQADVGLDAVVHAAGVDLRQQTFIGRLRIRDNEYIVPLGGRAILPFKRVELFAGGGAAYLHYAEQVEVPGAGSDSNFDCQVCQSRGGWGYYGIAGVHVAVDRQKRFFVGTETRLVRGRTSGDSLGSVPPLETHDAWLNTAAVFMVRFPW